MKRSVLIAAILTLVAALLVFVPYPMTAADNTPNVPVMRELDPFSAKVGQEVLVKGEFLSKRRLVAVFLTKGDVEVAVKIVSQTDDKLKFVVPEVEPGTYRPAVMMVEDTRLIEQPVILLVKP